VNFEIQYRFTNQNSEAYPFLWKMHRPQERPESGGGQFRFG